ncbi:MAG: hypothetical protein AAB655_00250 [Patescibacteria group bacterium]
MKSEKSFKVGEECIYEDDGGQTLCVILERSWDGKWLKLKLKALKTMVESPIVGKIPEGAVFEISKRFDFGYTPALWNILDPSAADVLN